MAKSLFSCISKNSALPGYDCHGSKHVLE